MDILPAQASAVSVERVFSSSKETDTARRSRLSPELFEALQILKYSVKRRRLDFTGWQTAKEEDYTIEGPVTLFTIQRLVDQNKLSELAELLDNSKASLVDPDSALIHK